MADSKKANRTKSKAKKTKNRSAKANKATASAKGNGAETGTAVAASAPIDFVKSNAVPISLVATGVGLLAAKTVNGGDNAVMNAAGRGRARAAAGVETVKGRAADIRERSRKGVKKARDGVRTSAAGSRQLVATHPVATGLAAAALGASLAFALPKLINNGRNKT